MNIELKSFWCSMFKFTVVLWGEGILVFSKQCLDSQCAHDMGQGWREMK